MASFDISESSMDSLVNRGLGTYAKVRLFEHGVAKFTGNDYDDQLKKLQIEQMKRNMGKPVPENDWIPDEVSNSLAYRGLSSGATGKLGSFGDIFKTSPRPKNVIAKLFRFRF